MEHSVIQIQCEFVRNIYEHKDSGFRVGIYRTKSIIPTEAVCNRQDGFMEIKACGKNIPFLSGSLYTLFGVWNKDKHGYQLEVFKVEERTPSTVDELEGYLGSGLFHGIGPATAKRIIETFGEKTEDIILNHSERLTEVRGVTLPILANLRKVYSETSHRCKTIGFFRRFGISMLRIRQIYEHFGAETLQAVQSNPYCLCSVSDIGFCTTDMIAIKLGIRFNDCRRIDAALLNCVSAMDNHVFLTVSTVVQKVLSTLSSGNLETVDIPTIHKRLQAMIHSNTVQLEYHLMQTQNGVKNMPVIYNRCLLSAEIGVAKAITYYVKTPTSIPRNFSLILDSVCTSFAFIPSEEQKAAIKMVFENNLSCITGGPGTGKSTLLKIILELFKRTVGGHVCMAAPTAAAAQRMSETATTIHRMIGIIPGQEFSSDKKVQAGFVILDEISMLDLPLAFALFASLPKQCKILLIGDPNQLPSVGPGQVLRDILESGQIPTTKLCEVYRQSGTSRIALNANLIGKNKTALLYGPDFMFHVEDNDEICAQRITERYLELVSVHGVNHIRILSPLRGDTVVGCEALSKRIQCSLFPHGGKEFNGVRFCKGDLVMQTETDDKNGIPNGTCGSIVSFQGNKDFPEAEICFNNGKNVHYTLEEMKNLELAYATTIHKSQGQEFSYVLIPLVQRSNRLLTRNLLYTAITRAKQAVEIFGQRRALFMAIHNDKGDLRNSRLATRIKEFMTTEKGE